MLTYIGIAISDPVLLIVIIVVLREKSLHTTGRLIIVNMAMAIFVSLTVFVTSINKTVNSHNCTRTAMVLHYFFLAAFSWMLLNGFFLWRKFWLVMQAHRDDIRFRVFFIIGWGIPGIIVAICAGGWPSYYGNETACWLTGSFLWAFLGPVVVILTVNVIFFAMIMHTIITLKVSSKITTKSAETRQKLMQAFKASALFFPVMGLTWVFGLLALEPNTSVGWQYLFVLFNSLQGLFLFIFHFVMDKSVQAWFRQKRKSTLSSSSPVIKKKRVTTHKAKILPQRRFGNRLEHISPGEQISSINTNSTLEDSIGGGTEENSLSANSGHIYCGVRKKRRAMRFDALLEVFTSAEDENTVQLQCSPIDYLTLPAEELKYPWSTAANVLVGNASLPRFTAHDLLENIPSHVRDDRVTYTSYLEMNDDNSCTISV